MVQQPHRRRPHDALMTLNRKLERRAKLLSGVPACDNSAMRYLACLAATSCLAFSLAACGSVTSPSQLAAFDFSGTLAPLGQANQQFSVNKTGEMQLTLQSLAPRPVVGFVTVAIGLPAGTDCQPLGGYYLAQAAVGQQYAFPQISKGTYCLLIADANGVLAVTASFTLRLLHP